MRYKIVCTVFLVLQLISCQKKQDEMLVAEDTISVPAQKFTATTLHFYNKGSLQWKLDADYMCKPMSDTGMILVVPVTLSLYDSVGSVRSRVIADSGRIASNMSSYNVWGNVYIRTRDSMVVRTERLKWFKEQQKVESDTFVQIETKKGDVLRGKGLNANEDFSHFSFKAEVTGTFPDFDKRVETNDDKLF